MRQARVEHGAPRVSKKRTRRGAKKRARFAIKSPIKLLNGLVPAPGPTPTKEQSRGFGQ